MTIIEAREKPPTFLAIQATMENFKDLVDCFYRIAEVTVKADQSLRVLYTVAFPAKDDGTSWSSITVPEGDYFVWQRDMDPRSALLCVPKHEFIEKYELDR